MFKMVSVVVLRTKRLEAVVKNLENQRDDKKDAFKRAILAKAGGISRGDICASTICLASNEQYSGLVIDNSFLMEDGGKSVDLGLDCPENFSYSLAVRTLKPSPEIVSNLYYPRVVLSDGFPVWPRLRPLDL